MAQKLIDEIASQEPASTYSQVVHNVAPATVAANAPSAEAALSLQLKEKVRATVLDLVGMDDVADDTPLMNTGLTSQAAVLLRNALSKEFPGPSLPFTMMFDYPSISALSDFLVVRTK